MRNPHEPLYTVVTVTYNSSKWVREAIGSILNQSFEDFELIIADDGSSDNTWEIICSYQDERIIAYRNKSNLGEYPNRHKAVSMAKGRYLLFVDGDDILYKHSLLTLSWYVKAFPSAGMVWGVATEYFGFMVFPYLVNPLVNIQMLYCSLLPVSNIGFGEVLFKTALLKQHGLNHNLAMGDIYIRKKLALQHDVLYIPRGIMFWRQSSNQASKKVVANYKGVMERILIDRMLTSSAEFVVDPGLRKAILRNLAIRDTKSIARNTLFRQRPLDFWSLWRKMSFSISDLKFLFVRGDFSYIPVSNISEPLMNNFNFQPTEQPRQQDEKICEAGG